MASQQACLRWILSKIFILCGEELTEKNGAFVGCPHFFAKPPNYMEVFSIVSLILGEVPLYTGFKVCCPVQKICGRACIYL